MSAFIVDPVSGAYVYNVMPNQRIQYFANDMALQGWSHTTEFLITDEGGIEYLRQRVSINLIGNAWLDAFAPADGNKLYYFYPDSANLYDRAAFFVKGAPGGGSGTLIISISPPAAVVVLGGVKVNAGSMTLAQGSYAWSANATGYTAQEGSVDVFDGSSSTLNIVLVAGGGGKPPPGSGGDSGISTTTLIIIGAAIVAAALFLPKLLGKK